MGILLYLKGDKMLEKIKLIIEKIKNLIKSFLEAIRILKG
jgi:hypothetical protein